MRNCIRNTLIILSVNQEALYPLDIFPLPQWLRRGPLDCVPPASRSNEFFAAFAIAIAIAIAIFYSMSKVFITTYLTTFILPLIHLTTILNIVITFISCTCPFCA